jgi:hypothetical protein
MGENLLVMHNYGFTNEIVDVTNEKAEIKQV